MLLVLLLKYHYPGEPPGGTGWVANMTHYDSNAITAVSKNATHWANLHVMDHLTAQLMSLWHQHFIVKDIFDDLRVILKI